VWVGVCVWYARSMLVVNVLVSFTTLAYIIHLTACLWYMLVCPPPTHYCYNAYMRNFSQHGRGTTTSARRRRCGLASTVPKVSGLISVYSVPPSPKKSCTILLWWLGSRVVSVLDSGAEGPGFKSQSRRCRVTVLGKLFTPIVLLFTKQQNWQQPS